MTQALTTGASAPVFAIGETIIRQRDGLFSLNDFHKAAGSLETHKPKFWLVNKQTQALIAEIQKGGILPFIVRRGVHGGTYACRELVIAYAAWINPAFHLMVLRVFLDRAAPQSLPSATITPDQAGELATLIAERFPDGNDRPYAWGRFDRHFRIARYRELPASRFAEACAYIRQMPGRALAVPAPVITPRQAEALAVRVTALYATADQAYVWNKFNKHFNVAGYRALPAHRFDEAMMYLANHLIPSKLAALPFDAPPLEYPVPVKDRKYDRGNPYPRDGETIEMAQEIAIAIRNWAQSQPSSPASKSLAKAADTLHDLLVTGWTEVDEALSAMSRATHYLHRWQGRGGRIGNIA